MRSPLGRRIAAMALAATSMTLAVPAVAQDEDARIRKLEAEVRALQRSVFPGGDGKYFAPEVSTQAETASAVGSPASGVVTDILGRLDALEGSIAQLTARTEVNENALREMSAQMETMNAQLTALRGTATTSAGITPTPGPVPVTSTAAPAPATTTPTPSAQPGAGAATTVAAPSPQRLAAVQAIAKPDSGDAGDDEYSYGFRLWDAGFYPEAQQQLRLFVDQYPSHWRTTYGRNLLGRAFLDDGKPREAAPWFLENYQKDKTAARAGDSLLFLAESMIAMDDTNRACIALAEFGDTYPALAAGRLKSQYDANRAKVECS